MLTACFRQERGILWFIVSNVAVKMLTRMRMLRWPELEDNGCHWWFWGVLFLCFAKNRSGIEMVLWQSWWPSVRAFSMNWTFLTWSKTVPWFAHTIQPIRACICELAVSLSYTDTYLLRGVDGVRLIYQGPVQSLSWGWRRDRGRDRYILVGVSAGGDGVGGLVWQEHRPLWDVGRSRFQIR